MNPNPYSTPAANPHGSPNPAGVGTVSAAAVQQLAATKPWVRMMSVITFIGAGFMLLAAAMMVVLGSVGTLAKGSAGSPFVGGMGFGLAGLYAVLSIVYIFPGFKLWKYADSIARLIQSGLDEDLVAALNQQRSFWKFVGILVIAMLVLYVVAIVAFVIIGGVTAAKLHNP